MTSVSVRLCAKMVFSLLLEVFLAAMIPLTETQTKLHPVSQNLPIQNSFSQMS